MATLLASALDRIAPPSPNRPGSPHESFQRKFLAGANVLAAAVTVPSLAMTLHDGDPLGTRFLLAFGAATLAQLAALRLGARPKAMIWVALGVLAAFLTSDALITADLDPLQLQWLVLLPLGALVFNDPGGEPAQASRRGPILVGIGTVVLGLLIIVAHRLGFTLHEPSTPTSDLDAVINFVTFMAAAGGLILLYDHSARGLQRELAALRQLLSVCAWCKRIREEQKWVALDEYVARRAPVTHGICPDCLKKNYPE